MYIVKWIMIVVSLATGQQVSRAPYHVYSSHVECKTASDRLDPKVYWTDCVPGDNLGPPPGQPVQLFPH